MALTTLPNSSSQSVFKSFNVIFQKVAFSIINYESLTLLRFLIIFTARNVRIIQLPFSRELIILSMVYLILKFNINQKESVNFNVVL